MNLKNMTLEERCIATKDYPVVITGYPKAGKSAAVEMLSEEDKKRTVIIDAENKGLPEDDDSEYFRIVRLKYVDSSTKYKDYGNVKYKTVDEIIPYIRAVMKSDDVDRVVLDSFTAYVAELERLYVTTSNGFTVWNNYNQQLHDFFRTIKEECRAHGKFLYVLGHYRPARDKKDPEAESFMVVKGNAHYRLVEANFNTVVALNNFRFVADNADETNSTRIRRSLSPYESSENSLAELEETLAASRINKNRVK